MLLTLRLAEKQTRKAVYRVAVGCGAQMVLSGDEQKRTQTRQIDATRRPKKHIPLRKKRHIKNGSRLHAFGQLKTCGRN